MDRNTPRVLVIQVKRIGDLVVSAPLCASLRKQLPGAHITLLARGVAGKLAPLIAGVDECLVLKEGAANPAIWMRLLRRRFDIALDLSGNDRSAFATLLSGAKQRVTFAKWKESSPLRGRLYNVTQPGSIGKQHMTDFYLGLLKAIGLTAERVPAALTVPHGNDDAATLSGQIREWQTEGRKLAVIHPGTAEANKYWQAERWAAIVDHLAQEHQCAVVISRGNDPVELAHIAEIKSFASQPIGSDEFLPLRELVAVLNQCDIALGVDTGAMHIAASLQKPQVVLFGPSNADQWGPRHNQSRTLRPNAHDDKAARSMSGITVEAALAAIDELFYESESNSTSGRESASA